MMQRYWDMARIGLSGFALVAVKRLCTGLWRGIRTLRLALTIRSEPNVRGIDVHVWSSDALVPSIDSAECGPSRLPSGPLPPIVPLS